MIPLNESYAGVNPEDTAFNEIVIANDKEYSIMVVFSPDNTIKLNVFSKFDSAQLVGSLIPYKNLRDEENNERQSNSLLGIHEFAQSGIKN
jgi:hypothetical protein